MLAIRCATRQDVPLIRQFIYELAEYERAPDEAVATEADLLRDGFGQEPKFRVVIAEWEGQPAGFALFFYNYSTWQGRPGLYLEDLFVRPAFRRHGIGRALLSHLARTAVDRKCTRFVWQVLDWNEGAIRFYETLGARGLRDWVTMRSE